MTAYERFLALPTPSGEGQIVAEPLEDGALIRVGKRNDRAPAILLPGADRLEGYGVSLRRLQYVPSKVVEVEGPGGLETGAYSILVCTEVAPDFQRYFFRVVEALLAEIGFSPDSEDFDRGVRRIIALFRALSAPGSRSLQGLWAEVLLIAHSRDPKLAVAAWHSAGSDAFDFEMGQDRLEIKSASGGMREHDVALAQLETGTGGATAIASVLLDDSGRGESLDDLVALLYRRIGNDGELKLRIESILASSLGDGWQNASNLSFNAHEALLSVRFFLADRIPSVSRDYPSQVSRVRFRVDLSGEQPLTTTAVASLGPLFANLLPNP